MAMGRACTVAGKEANAAREALKKIGRPAVPALIFYMDLAKMVGYPAGIMDRLRAGRGGDGKGQPEGEPA